MKQGKRLKIAFLSAECAPFVKVGGLGDVVGSLPMALEKLDVRPAVFLPLNKDVNLKKWKAKKAGYLSVKYEGKEQKVEIYKTKLGKSSVPVYFLSNERYFNKEDVYGGKLKKFLFYNLAGLEAIKALGWKPDIIHCHDHQTGMAPNILKSAYKNDKFFADARTVYTIHNLDYQGRQNPEILDSIGNNIERIASVANDIKDGDINFMVQGILAADAVTTVSPTYAKEILTKEFGCGLENILKKRRKDLFGILNGIDVNIFNPESDKSIIQNYSAEELEKKTENKLWLQKKLGLPADENKPLACFISRLAWQKGVELLTEGDIRECYSRELDCQFAILGTGEKKYEEQLRKLAKKYPKKFSAQIKFDIKLAQQIYAGSDIFLMPSRYEPCGLGQMIAMRYGAVPVARGVGGLRDTVVNFHRIIARDAFTGFVFKEFSSESLQKALQRALDVYYKKPRQWRQLQINGMKRDFSWDKSAEEYARLYRKLVKKITTKDVAVPQL